MSRFNNDEEVKAILNLNGDKAPNETVLPHHVTWKAGMFSTVDI